MKNRIYISLAFIVSVIAILSFESEKKVEERLITDLLSVENITPFDSSTRLHEGRPKIEWICYGQRFEHECEETMQSEKHSAQGFGKPQQMGGIDSIDIRFGKGSRVRYFRSAFSDCPGDKIDTSGIVLSGFTFGNGNSASEENEIESYLREIVRIYKIKPRIRIDSVFAVNNPSARVCEVIVCDSRGRVVKRSVVKAANFFEDFNIGYDGSYKDNFNFMGMGDTSMLNILGSALETGTQNSQRANYSGEIRIRWFGECDMWIDRVRIDDLIADELLDPSVSHQYEWWIASEAKFLVAGNQQSANRFDIQSYFPNGVKNCNVACFEYVSKRLTAYTAECNKLNSRTAAAGRNF